jgi:hypothetical protein
MLAAQKDYVEIVQSLLDTKPAVDVIDYLFPD